MMRASAAGVPLEPPQPLGPGVPRLACLDSGVCAITLATLANATVARYGAAGAALDVPALALGSVGDVDIGTDRVGWLIVWTTGSSPTSVRVAVIGEV